MGERSAVIIKNEGFAALILDARIGDAVHGAWLGRGGDGALSLLESRLAKVGVGLVVINSEIAEGVAEVVFIIIVIIVGLVIVVTIEPAV